MRQYVHQSSRDVEECRSNIILCNHLLDSLQPCLLWVRVRIAAVLGVPLLLYRICSTFTLQLGCKCSNRLLDQPVTPCTPKFSYAGKY